MIRGLYYRLHRNISRPEERGEYSSGYWQDIIRCRSIEKIKGAGGCLLEVGCGEGLLLAKIARIEQSLNIFGIDVNRKLLLRAESRIHQESIRNVRLYNASAYALPFRNNLFDIVICINTFFNMPSYRDVFRALAEIRRVCKSGGKIVFDIRNSLNPLLFFKYRFARFYDETVQDIPLNTYKISNIISFLNGHGIRVVDKAYIGFPYNAFAPIVIVEARKI